jgi:hypothetical protein
MDVATFDQLARTLGLAGTRRAALATLLAGAGTALGLTGEQRASAQGCTSNGARCQDGTECCSGRCKPKRHTHHHISVCRQADNQGACTVGENICAGSSDFSCGTGSLGLCHCFVTTTGRSFCGAFFNIRRTDDCDCTSNDECEDRIGKGAKCIQTGTRCVGPSCPPSTTSGCMAPCQHLDPVP